MTNRPKDQECFALVVQMYEESLTTKSAAYPYLYCETDKLIIEYMCNGKRDIHTKK